MQILPLFILSTLLIAAALSDIISLRIPNWLTLLIAALFFPFALIMQMPWAEFQWHLLAGAILLGAGYLLFTFGVFGAGDGKLMAATGLWIGTLKLFPFLFVTALVGGALAICIGIWSVAMMFWEFEGEKAPLADLGKRLRALKPSVPYGVALAVGGIVAFKDTWWMNGLH